MALLIGTAHVPPIERSRSPKALLARDLAKRGNVRRGDFGEVLAAALYRQRFDSSLPFSKLWNRPSPDATQQGADLLALAIDPIDPSQPVIVEVKTRTGTIYPSTVLSEIRDGGAERSEDYLQCAWRSSVTLMSVHPDHEKAFSYSAARHCSQLDDPDRPGPDHVRHAVIICEDPSGFTNAKIEEYWANDVPATLLAMILRPDLQQVIDDCYGRASGLCYADLAFGIPPWEIWFTRMALKLPVARPATQQHQLPLNTWRIVASLNVVGGSLRTGTASG